MKKNLVTNIQRLFGSAGFWGTSLAVCLFLFVSQTDTIVDVFRKGELKPYGYPLAFIINGLSGDTLLFLTPILCALPYTASFVEDMKSGIIKSLLPRTTKGVYLWSRVLVCALSGGLVLVLGIVLSAGVSFLVFAPMEMAAAEGDSIRLLIGELLVKIQLFFVSGALWSVFGMLMATLTGSWYVAYTAPFICYYILIILYERYFPSLTMIYPKAWLVPGSGCFPGNFGVVLWVSELTVIAMLLFVISAGRRLEHV